MTPYNPLLPQAWMVLLSVSIKPTRNFSALNWWILIIQQFIDSAPLDRAIAFLNPIPKVPGTPAKE